MSNDDEVSGNYSTQFGNEWVVKLNDTGAIQWQKCLGGTGGDQANSIIQIPGGDYVVAGLPALMTAMSPAIMAAWMRGW